MPKPDSNKPAIHPGAYGPAILQHGTARWLVLAALVILVDQLSKLWVASTFQYHEVRPVTGYFNLVLAHNPGAAFSFLAFAGGWQRHFFTVLALVVSVVIVRLLFRHYRDKLFSLAMALILGGALGNVIDRIAYGYVIDFLDFYAGSYHWPAFNVADSAICLGAALMVLDSFRKKPA